MIGLLLRRPPHRQHRVTDVIDEHPSRGDDFVGERREHVADPLHRVRGAETLAHPAEAADVAEEHRHLRVAASEEVGLGLEFGGQLRREELLELHLAGHGGSLLLQPCQARRHSAGERLDEQGLQSRDARTIRLRHSAGAMAVECADHPVITVEDRCGDERIEGGEAREHVGGLVGLAEEGALLREQS